MARNVASGDEARINYRVFPTRNSCRIWSIKPALKWGCIDILVSRRGQSPTSVRFHHS